MRIEDCRRGMEVLFGRPNGEQTRAEVVKLNPTKAKLRTLEPRGRDGHVGLIWSVPYSMMTPVKPGLKQPPAQHRTEATPGNLALDVTVGEYRVVFGPTTTLQAYRHGIEWRKLDGDNLVLALAQAVHDLQARVIELEMELDGGPS